ncbi:MAG TPA: o-succinylbenzoate synthase [Desulfobacteraceae bacterium]|nr:o-succinylbenzoate synthase [Desulfobacteraceae bacterium]
MQIERVDLIQLKIPMTGHFETSYYRRYESDKLILKFYTPDHVAWTECVAGAIPGYSYETINTARVILKEHFLPLIIGRDLDGPEDFWPLFGRFRGHSMTKASVENALWIFKALEEDISLAKLLGNRKDRVISGVSIGIQDTSEDLVRLAAEYLEKGYPKIKMKIKPGTDLERVDAMRSAFPDIKLMVDANNAYSLEDLETLRELDRYNLLMIEQPLEYEDVHDHAKLQAMMQTPICLDESIQGPYFARLAAETSACRIINIKQGRVAGLAKAREIHDLCREAGIGVWCGGMFETGIGRALILALAGLDNFIYPSDISASDRYYHRDIVDPEFTLNPDGTIDVPRGPGLGVEVNEKVLEDYTVAREVIRFKP